MEQLTGTPSTWNMKELKKEYFASPLQSVKEYLRSKGVANVSTAIWRKVAGRREEKERLVKDVTQNVMAEYVEEVKKEIKVDPNQIRQAIQWLLTVAIHNVTLMQKQIESEPDKPIDPDYIRKTWELLKTEIWEPTKYQRVDEGWQGKPAQIIVVWSVQNIYEVKDGKDEQDLISIWADSETREVSQDEDPS